jgi:hypothetical protein
MNRNCAIGISCLLAATTLCLSPASAAGQPASAEPQSPLTASGSRLLAKYSGMLGALQEEIAKAVPEIDERKKDAFLKANAGEAAVKADPAAYQELVRSQETTLKVAEPILSDVANFLAGDALDARLVRCAVLANATPRALAEFAGQGNEQEALVEKLLADDDLMRQMLIAGGAKGGNYARAIRIYAGIQKASQHAHQGILQRLALGTSLEHAVPVKGETDVDPVKRYLNYEKAYLNGELDPAFKRMTAWECRLITNDPFSDEEILWGREMLRNYRPDVIFEPDYRWRYSRLVKTDVAYKNPEWGAVPGHKAAQLLNGGGKCGPRAWFGRFALRCFGIPTWGVQQRGHAALSHWTPAGWTVNFGAAWQHNWWEDRAGPDFLLETQARRQPRDNLKVLRAQWVGDALGEKKVDGRRPGTGGLWHALALNQKRVIVAAAKPAAVALAGEDLAEANEPTKAEAILKAEITPAEKQIVAGKDGVIAIPAVACSTPRNNTQKIVFMKSFSGGMQLHYNRLGNPEGFEYTFDVPKAGKYALAARVVTVNKDQQLLLTPNDAETQLEIALPYTAGMWQETKPVELALGAGRNMLRFTCKVPNCGLTIKQFTLTPLELARADVTRSTEELIAEAVRGDIRAQLSLAFRYRDGSGATASATLARFQGAKIGGWDFKRLCPSPVGTGTDWGDLLKAAEKIGLRWKLVTFTPDDAGFEQATAFLRSELDAGHPVVIDFKFTGPDYPGGEAGHTLGVAGSIASENLSILCNPAIPTPGLQFMTAKDLKRC